MTDNALRDFRTSRGWAVGANVEYVFQDSADSFSANTTTSSSPVIAIMFAQAGIRLGATLDGTKYTRIIP
jgi:lipid-binding SYLF domain-containing protein